MNYGEVIRRAFSIARHRRNLWFFGFFAGGSAGSGGCNFNVPSGSGEDSGDFSDFGTLLAENVELLIAIAITGVALVLLAFALSLISQGGLADSVAAIDRGEERSFGATFRAGLGTFWRMLGLTVLLVIVATGLVIAVGGPVALAIFGIVSATESLGLRIAVIVIVALIGLVAFFALIFVLTVVGAFSIRALAVGRERAAASLRAGYRLFRSRLGTSLLLAIIAFGLSLAAGLALFAGTLILGLPLALPAILLGVYGYSGAAIALGIVAGVVVVAVLLVASGALGTFNHAFWTIAYLRLTSPPPPTPPPTYGAPPPAVGPAG